MINVNLLPDVKMERVNAIKRQRLIGGISTLAIGIGVAVPIFLIILWGGQKALLAITQRSINNKSDELKKVENLETILTVQQQLDALPEIEQKRVYHTTLLSLMPKLMPQNASLVTVNLLDNGTVKIQGKADSLSTVNDYVNILDRAELKKGDETKPAFNDVTLVSGFPAEEGASFEITFSYDASLVSKLLEYSLSVADKVLYEPPVAESSSTPDDATDGATEETPLFGEEQIEETP